MTPAAGDTMKTTKPARNNRNFVPAPGRQTGALAQAAQHSPASQSLAALQRMADQSAVVQNMQNPAALQRMEEDELQGQFIQRVEEEAPKTNNTGLPDNLKSGIENLSGMSMDHAKVHRNSDKPAAVQARAYAQGSNIHLAPGQEKHLPHEAWHVVQQAQGRVKPTMQMKGVAVNDDPGLEAEADVMGARALQMQANATSPAQRKMAPIIQRTVATAAQALFDAGSIKVTAKNLKGKFANTHAIDKTDKAAIQTALDLLRAASPVAPAGAGPVDMTNNANWPTAGGMSEADGAVVAGTLDYHEVKSTKMTCSDPLHTPKGHVYSNGSAYYGADKDGHVGWGFKVWEKKKGNMLDYKGNITWDGTKWNYKDRGT